MKYADLSDDAKEHARQWFIETLDDWWDYIYADAKEILTFLGFNVADIFFSGFWSQGDGACFHGTWAGGDVKIGKVKEHAPDDAELHRLAEAIEKIAARWQTIYTLDKDTEVCEPAASLTHNGNYCHEHTIEFDSEPEYWLEGQEEEFIDTSRGLMKWIYKQLEQEHEYQTSEEAVAEAMEANEWEFDEDGNIEMRRAA